MVYKVTCISMEAAVCKEPLDGPPRSKGFWHLGQDMQDTPHGTIVAR